MPVWPRLPATLSAIAIVFVLAQNGAAASPAVPPKNGAPEQMCRDAVAAAENLAGIPQHLMSAISLVESGIFMAEAGGRIAWPWTVMAQGRGRYFKTKEDAINAVRGLLRSGVTNIDVGCMQINLQYHALAFSSLEEAFDPVTNVAYSASFLMELKGRHGNWDKAVRYYHSATPARNIPYRKKVRAELVALRQTGKAMSAAEHSRLAGEFAPDNDGQDSPPLNSLRQKSQHLGKAPYGGVMAPAAAGNETPLIAKTGESPIAAVPNGPPNINDADKRLSYLKTASWPPRSLKAQYQMEHNARARVMHSTQGRPAAAKQTLTNPFLKEVPLQTASNPDPS
ncbi:hypothetical protein EOI86_21005 [Hwanghaeella grinnelliae]|uniref:Lytic transglycosylase domain-containing protein n=1 Tax=Hwanghaeella grinnelliae TaxID=2500179 RepID=A0A437QH64_9PROT|nr:hypothetical protein [Hwanghaeella grinnelliae]RVU33640.1 hypothetical protein EOI86_21005 [Hwanghaeella grinnelliae]